MRLVSAMPKSPRSTLLLGASMVGALATGCKPPDAPEKLEQLTGYLFEHVRDEDPDALEVGVANLNAWLEKNQEEAELGYTIDKLSERVVDDLDNRERDLGDLVGASVAGQITYKPAKVTGVLVTADATKVYPDTYTKYDRNFREDPQCFKSQECDWLTLRAHSIANYSLGLVADSTFDAEYRWVESEHGLAMVQRTWLIKPVEFSQDWLAVPSQFFLSVNIPMANGHTRRLQATWIDARLGDTPVPEATALDMVIDSMIESDIEVQAWLEQ